MVLMLASCAPVVAPPEPAPAPVVAPTPAPVPEPLPEEGPFVREVSPGLVVAACEPPATPDLGYARPDPRELAGADPRLFVVTIDPALYELRLLSVLEPAIGGPTRTAAEWARDFDLEVAFNPGMYEPDGRGTGHTRAGAFWTQPQVRTNGLYRAWFLAEPLGGTAPRVLDQPPSRSESPWDDLQRLPEGVRTELDRYDLVVQSLPILRDGRPAYPARKNAWSELAFGVDDRGRVMVVFSRWPYEMRELGARIAALGIGARDLVHGEGGPEASLVVRSGGVELVRFGSFETGFWDDSNGRAWPIPGVIGARRRGP